MSKMYYETPTCDHRPGPGVGAGPTTQRKSANAQRRFVVEAIPHRWPCVDTSCSRRMRYVLMIAINNIRLDVCSNLQSLVTARDVTVV